MARRPSTASTASTASTPQRQRRAAAPRRRQTPRSRLLTPLSSPLQTPRKPKPTPRRRRSPPASPRFPSTLQVRLLTRPPGPVEYRLQNARIRTLQREKRSAEQTALNLLRQIQGISSPVGSPGGSISTNTSYNPANLNTLGTKAEAFVRQQQQVRAYQDAVKRAESLDATMDTLQRQETVYRNALANARVRAARLRARNTARILAERSRGSPPQNEALIRQEHNAAIGMLQQEASTIRDTLRAILTRQEAVRGDLEAASQAAMEARTNARAAQSAIESAARNLVRTPLTPTSPALSKRQTRRQARQRARQQAKQQSRQTSPRSSRQSGLGASPRSQPGLLSRQRPGSAPRSQQRSQRTMRKRR
jgi:hypothetical protein